MADNIKKILLIQTAFIGDVILATVLIEALKDNFPDSEIDFILRKGNENLLKGHPKLNKILIWDKSKKYVSLSRIVKECNNSGSYDLLINMQRFFTTGMMAARIKAKTKIGFSKNPLSLFMDYRIKHQIGDSKHEVQRNLDLLQPLGLENLKAKVRLYPNKVDKAIVKRFEGENYVTISPASVWFTKQFPKEKWVEFIKELPRETKIVLLGGPADRVLCDEIRVKADRADIINMAGKTNFLETAAIMKPAILNYSNDSAPLHMASSQNANVCAVFCSTVPDFGFGPLSDFSKTVEVEGLSCKPCGLHGYKACPKGHFKCALDLDIKKLLNAYNEAVNFQSN